MNKEMTQVRMLPISEVEVNTGQLEGLPANPREIRDEKFYLLKENIQKHPELLEYRSLMVYPMPNGKHIIIGGNMRYRAMADLGYTEVPCVILPKETTTEKLAAYTILDNNGFGKWDWDLLANEWESFDLDNLGLDGFASTDINIDDFFDEVSQQSEGKPKDIVIQVCIPDEEADIEKDVREKIKEVIKEYTNVSLK